MALKVYKIIWENANLGSFFFKQNIIFLLKKSNNTSHKNYALRPEENMIFKKFINIY